MTGCSVVIITVRNRAGKTFMAIVAVPGRALRSNSLQQSAAPTRDGIRKGPIPPRTSNQVPVIIVPGDSGPVDLWRTGDDGQGGTHWNATVGQRQCHCSRFDFGGTWSAAAANGGTEGIPTVLSPHIGTISIDQLPCRAWTAVLILAPAACGL